MTLLRLKSAKNCDFQGGVTDRWTDGLTDGRTDRPSYRDGRTHLKSRKTWFLHRQTLLWRCEDASKNAKTAQLYHSVYEVASIINRSINDVSKLNLRVSPFLQ